MKKFVVVSVSVLSLAVMAAPGFCAAKKAEKIDAKAKFDQHCVACHPNGGNIIRPDKTLSKKSLAAHGVKSEKDIVAKMRNPGPGMTKFDAKAVPDAEANAIAKYIMATFK
ncbi:cytochrome C [Geoanaerobacter pelophilus]|uniref:Cytochrome C n=1 Tax=Geoanaerobacter pelophilus TaxID=60036 RepID=A0ABQ0MHC6_9BACT|nr:c-type cytochrome [Geoanaerobacter pelophilus]GAW66344.1 cytochrome C [Geoanaerobacter pelophilus]